MVVPDEWPSRFCLRVRPDRTRLTGRLVSFSSLTGGSLSSRGASGVFAIDSPGVGAAPVTLLLFNKTNGRCVDFLRFDRA